MTEIFFQFISVVKTNNGVASCKWKEEEENVTIKIASREGSNYIEKVIAYILVVKKRDKRDNKKQIQTKTCPPKLTQTLR